MSTLKTQYGLKRIIVLGGGSNTVFIEDFPSLVLINKIKGIDVQETGENYKLRVGAGENWHSLVSYCIEENMGGFENLALIPGTVGAAPIQNIGAYGIEIERFIETVEFYDTISGTFECFSNKECQFAYRDSIFKTQKTNHRIITHVNFILPKSYTFETSYGPLRELKVVNAKTIFQHVIKIRQSKLPDPNILGNAGSFFKNPIVSVSQLRDIQKQYKDIPFYRLSDELVKIPAAWLIDTLQFKGKRLGDIECYIRQPLVLVNHGNGTGADLLALAREIKDTVLIQFGILLENEVRLIGANGIVRL